MIVSNRRKVAKTCKIFPHNTQRKEGSLPLRQRAFLTWWRNQTLPQSCEVKTHHKTNKNMVVFIWTEKTWKNKTKNINSLSFKKNVAKKLPPLSSAELQQHGPWLLGPPALPGRVLSLDDIKGFLRKRLHVMCRFLLGKGRCWFCFRGGVSHMFWRFWDTFQGRPTEDPSCYTVIWG